MTDPTTGILSFAANHPGWHQLAPDSIEAALAQQLGDEGRLEWRDGAFAAVGTPAEQLRDAAA